MFPLIMRELLNINRKQCFNNAKKDALKSEFLDRTSRPWQRFSGTSTDISSIFSNNLNHLVPLFLIITIGTLLSLF